MRYCGSLCAGARKETALNEHADPLIGIVLVDHQTLFREGLQALIDREPDLSVIAHASSVGEFEGLGGAKPRVIVTDLTLADASRAEVVQRLRQRFAECAILALTMLDDLATVQQVLAAGADGDGLKSAPKTDLFAGIRAVARGGLYLQPSIGVAFASRPPEEPSPPAVGGLTPKETDVLHLLALGHTNAEIAQLLGARLRSGG